MRVAWVVYGSLEQPTGGYVYDRLVIDGLRAAGDGVDVISIEPDIDACSLAARAARGDPEAIVGDALACAELGPAFELLPCPRVLLVHHLSSWEPEADDRDLHVARERRAISASTHLIATSQASARRLERENPERSASVVCPGADRLPRRRRAANESLGLLSVGSLIPRKRLDVVLEAFRQIDEPSARLRVVGDPERDAACARSLRAQIALDPRVELLGVVPDSALALELARAHALVLASSLEGYGMVLTEACHAGLPALVARSAALHEVTAGARDVLLFDDAAELARLLRRFLDDPSLRSSMLASAEARAQSLPRWSDTVAKFRAELLSARRER